MLDDLGTTLRAWVVGQLAAMVVLAALTTLGLWVLDVPYFLAFGVFAGIAAIVPFFGTLLRTVIPALIALGVSGLGKAVAVAGVGVGVHLIEANFVSPVVMERQVNLPPVLTIAGVLLLGKLFGLAGLVVAVPSSQLSWCLSGTCSSASSTVIRESKRDPRARRPARDDATIPVSTPS